MALADPQRIEALDPLDPLALEAELSDEERMVRDTARSYATDALMPRVTSAFLDERFDREIMREMGSLGLLGATIAPEYGGAGEIGSAAGRGRGLSGGEISGVGVYVKKKKQKKS